MTFILNILQKDMTIMAADRMAIAEWKTAAMIDFPVRANVTSVVHDYNKITLNSTALLALGIAGNTQDHSYLNEIEVSASINDGLQVIRNHMESFLRVNNRANLNTMTSFTVNQVIASFFDQNAGAYFSNEFLFSPIRNQTRLYRGKDEIQIFHAGSGSAHYEKVVGKDYIDSFVASTKHSCTPEVCIPWMQDVFKRVGACDNQSWADAVFLVSTRNSPVFRAVESC